MDIVLSAITKSNLHMTVAILNPSPRDTLQWHVAVQRRPNLFGGCFKTEDRNFFYAQQYKPLAQEIDLDRLTAILDGILQLNPQICHIIFAIPSCSLSLREACRKWCDANVARPDQDFDITLGDTDETFVLEQKKGRVKGKCVQQ